MKKWMVGALALVVFALPSFASEEAEKQLEGQILALLQQGQYTQIKTLLEKIPVCPFDTPRLFQNQVPSRCTRHKFDPATLESGCSDDFTVQIKHDKDPEFAKPRTIPVVRPAQNLINAMNQHYESLYREKMTTYNREHYLGFQKQFANSWLKDVSSSVLVSAIWTPSNAFYLTSGSSTTEIAFNIGKALYADADWHKAQGLTMAQIAQKKYPEHLGTARRNPMYTLNGYSGHRFAEFLVQQFGVWTGPTKGSDGKWNITSWLYDGFWSEAMKHGNKALFHQYKQHVYYTLFATDKWEDLGYGSKAVRPNSSQSYAFFVVYNFGAPWLYPTPDDVWKTMAITMSQKQKAEMQANIKKHIVPFCENWDKVPSGNSYGWHILPKGNQSIKEMCKNFQKHAKQYGIWPEDETIVAQQIKREVKKTLSK